MQNVFGQYGISFTLKGVNRRVWGYPFCEVYAHEDEQSKEMRRATRLGTYADLNIWYNTFSIRAGHLGSATFPSLHPNPDTIAIDGVIVNHRVITGGSTIGRNEGDVRIHHYP